MNSPIVSEQFEFTLTKPFNETVLFEAMARYLGVRYRYCKKLQEPALPLQSNLGRQDLKFMPSAWLTQVHNAALDLQDERLYQLIAQIPDSEQWLIETMTSLVNNLQFEAIATLTQNQEESS